MSTRNSTAMKMEKLLAAREALLQNFKHHLEVIATFSEETSVTLIKLRKTAFMEIYKKVVANWSTIEVTPDPRNDLTDIPEKIEQNNAYEDSYYTALASLSEFLPNPLEKTFREGPNGDNEGAGTSFAQVKLPPIKIKTFEGDFDDWEEFRDTFQSCFSSKKDAVTDCQRFLYLKGVLGPQPLLLIKNLKVSNENYHLAWEVLEARYNNKRRIIYAHYRKLAEVPVIKVESAEAIRKLLDETSASMASIKLHYPDLGQLNEFIVFLLSQRLDKESKKHWEEYLDASTELPTFPQFKKFLETRFNILDGLQSWNAEEPTRSVESEASGSNRKEKEKGRFKVSAKTFQLNKKRDNYKCTICNGEHRPMQCPSLKNITVAERKQVILQHSLCHNCFYKHPSDDCKSNFCCSVCAKKHNTLLHEDEPVTSEGNTFVGHMANKQTALLATAQVMISTVGGSSVKLRALIDPGSTSNLISENAVQAIRAAKIKTQIPITTVGDNCSVVVKSKVNIIIGSLVSSYQIHTGALVVPKITNVSSLPSAVRNNWSHLQGLALADPLYHTLGKVDLLIGVETYAHIIMSGLIKGPADTPIAQRSELGWILSGGIGAWGSPMQSCFLTIDYAEDSSAEIDNRLKQMWELEEFKPQVFRTPDEQRCEEIFRETTIIQSDGRYSVALPFNQDPYSSNFLGDSFRTAKRRLELLEIRFQKNSQLKTDYTKVIQGHIEAGYLRLASDEEAADLTNAYFMPHHAVIKNSSTSTKTRVVFDASCKSTNGFSLNDRLHIGPVIQADLFTILLRWRQFRIAFSADITKMYLQFMVKPNDAKFQRILWRVNGMIRQFLSLTVTFGTSSAPFQAIRVLHDIAERIKDITPWVSEMLLNHFYVDDGLGGADSVQEAIERVDQLIKILANHHLDLSKWTSNSSQFLAHIPLEKRETKSNIEIGPIDTIKALGLYWNPNEDRFSYSITLPDRKMTTKRTFLSDFSMLFDPLGWLGPSLIVPKILMQRVWLKGIAWDASLPPDIAETWAQLRLQLQQLDSIHIPRWLGIGTEMRECSLHGFCDASEKAYSAVFYLRVVTFNDEITISIVAARTKVAPTKRVSLPRLELCGSYLLVHLLQKIQESYPNILVRAYTDSKIVLCWLEAHPSNWTCFIANRVTIIQEAVPASQWFHVKSKENPADCATRGLLPKQLAEHELWWQGPSFLKLPPGEWPKKPEELESVDQNLLERRPAYKHCFVIQKDHTQFPLADFLHRYSTFTRLMRATVHLIRFTKKRSWEQYRLKEISPEEIEGAVNMWVRIVQENYFSEEIVAARQGKTIPKESKLTNLSPILDSQELLRVYGRLSNADVPYNEKHPLIIPNQGHLTQLLIREAHEKTLHGGAQLTAQYLRQKYWIVHARRSIRAEVNKCVRCYRYRAKVGKQMMGNLPHPRVQPSLPFTHTGVDYAGYFEVKTSSIRSAPYVKCYIALFVCLCIKAFHLELVENQTTEAFIAAVRRFTARRGVPTDLYVDNGLYFVGAKNELPRLLLDSQSECSQEIVRVLQGEGIQFHFIPPHAPHFGGLWEAGVKSTKHHLKRIIGETRLRFEQFTTLITQIEAVLNSRPLCPLTADPAETQVITPAHFLIGRPLVTIPSPNVASTPSNRLDTYQLVQKLFQNFWNIWSREYLHRLQQRPKWTQPEDNFRVGQIVLVKEDNMPPGKWCLALITGTTKGKDDKIRVVNLKTATSIFQRPIHKICLLPIDDNSRPLNNP